MKHVARTLAVIASVLVVWQLIALAVDSTVLPAPLDIARYASGAGVSALLEPTLQTLRLATIGFVIGVVCSIAIGVLCVRFPRFEPVGLQFALLTYTVPVIALGSIMSTIWSADVTRITIAALYTVLTTVMGTILGLRSVDTNAMELVTVFGAPRARRGRLVEFPAAIPSILAALKIAAPAAVLGTVIGEYLGGEGGVGVAMVSAQRQGNVDRTWSLAISISLAAGLLYLAVAAVGRWVETRRSGTPMTNRVPTPVRRTAAVAAGRSAAALLIGVAAIVGLWYAALRLLDVDSFIGVTPDRVWEYLVTSPLATDNRSAMLDALITTMGHAAIGFIAGTSAGVLCAIALRLTPWAERLILPAAVAAQSVPIVALLPLAVLVVGRGTLIVALVAGLVSFFPTLVNIDTALARTPQGALDLMSANGAGTARSMVLTRLPFAAPALFTAARIAIPASVAGALLVEWLVLGDGIGRVMVTAGLQSRYTQLWSAVVVISIATTVLAVAARWAERRVSRRFGLASSLA
jgi:sulfonate transport system permease protein